MSKHLTRTLLLALACILAGRLAVADAGPGKKVAAPAKLTQVTYPVADLIVPLDNSAGAPVRPRQTNEDMLMKLIRAIVAPSSWADNGGPATVQYYPLAMSLVVNQTPAAHAQIAQLLQGLRRLQDIEVCVELRLVRTTPEVAAHFRAKAGFETPRTASEQRQPTALFTAKELYPWLLLLQNDAATEIMSAPKVTVFDGQNANVDIAQVQSFVTEHKVVHDKGQVKVVPQMEKVPLGICCKLQPIVTADRRAVRLNLDFRHTFQTARTSTTSVAFKVVGADGKETKFRGTIEQPHLQTLAVKRSFTIPDGQTVAIALGAVMVDGRNETGPPVLSDVPYLGRLFRNVGYSREARELFLLVTPRVIVNEEVEEAQR